MTVKLAPFYGHKNPNAPLLPAQFAPLAAEQGLTGEGGAATWRNCATWCHTDYCQDYDGLRLLACPLPHWITINGKNDNNTQQPQQHKQQQLQQVPTWISSFKCQIENWIMRQGRASKEGKASKKKSSKCRRNSTNQQKVQGGLRQREREVDRGYPLGLKCPSLLLFLGTPFFWAVLGLAAALKMLLK